MLDKLTEIFNRLKSSNVDPTTAVETISKLVHSPLVALAVTLSPNKTDDLVLDLLKGLFPAK